METHDKYIGFHIRILKGKSKKNKKSRKIILLLAAVFVLVYLIAGATIPYTIQPEVSETYQESFRTEDFYSETLSTDRAAIISDNGEALEERIRLMEHAKERIILSTFDFCSDTSGKQVIAALIQAAQRGVRVQVLMDGFYSWLHMEGNPWFYALAAEENVEVRIYNRLNPLFPWKGLSRMHDKYLIADDTAYILGGRNTFDYFLGDQDSYKNHDRDVLVYCAGKKESSLSQLTDYFAEVWNLDCCKPWKEGEWISKLPSVKKAEKELKQLYQDMKREHPQWFETIDYEKMTVETNKITLLSNPTGLYSKEPRVFYALGRLMEEAEEEVIIHTPYIICNDWMYDTFRSICTDGKTVKLMTNSALNNGNPFGAVDYALHKDEILDTGLCVLEYQGGVSYHGKSIAIDDELAIVGSFNMDMKSVYQDTELMLVIQSKELNKQLRNSMDIYHAEAVEADGDVDDIDALFQKRTPFSKKVERFLVKILNPWLRSFM